jgi:hypothetical protein
MAVTPVISIMVLTRLPSIKETIVNIEEVLAAGVVAVAAGVVAAPTIGGAGQIRPRTPIVARVELARRSPSTVGRFRFGAIG